MSIQPTSVRQATETPFVPIGELTGFETARFVAALFVVWIHASIDVKLGLHPDAGFWGRFAVPFFVLSSIFFASVSAWGRPQQTFSRYFSARFTRIYLPFIAWTIVYMVLKALQGRRPSWSAALLWDGSSYQLWYLPYVFVLCLCVFPAQRLVFRMQHQAKKIGFLCAMVGLGLALLPRSWLGDMRLLDSNAPFLWLDALPGAFFGFALACYYGFGDRKIRSAPRLAWLGLVVAPLCILASCAYLPLASALYNTAGLALALSALGISLTPTSRLYAAVKKMAPLGKLSFGIYLAHILFIGPMRSAAASHGWNTTVAFALVATVLASLASMLLTMGMLKSRRLAWMVK